MKFIFLTILLLALDHCGIAQTTPDLETDRPDQTETAFTVGKHKFQVENGYSLWKISHTEQYQNIVSLLRLGLSEKFELRAEIGHDRYDIKTLSQSTKGFAPLELGFKVNLVEEKGWRPKTSLIGHLALAKAASKEFRGNYTMPSFRFTMQHTLGKKQSISYNLGGEWETGDKTFTPLYTIASGYDFSSFLYGYLELFGFLPQQSGAEHSFAGGFAFLVRPNIQFDISGGVGITRAAPKNYFALGLSFRLPD